MPFASLPAARICARRSRLLATTALFCVFAPSSLTAVFAQDAAGVTELPAVVVTSATTVPTPVDQIASSVTVISAADIEREQRRTVADALATVPGLNVVQTGGPGGQASVYMRGTESGHVKVLIDGIDIGDPSVTNGAPNLGHLLTGDIERIEVLRGPQSGLYGSDAIGGVISITTKKGSGPAKATASLEGGSFGTFNQSAGVSGSQDKFNYAFDAVHLRATSTPTVPDAFVPTGTERINNYYDNKTVSSRLGYDFSENVSLNWVGRYTDAEYRYPNTYATAQDTQVVHQLFTRGEAVWTLFDGRVKNFFGVNYTDIYRWSTWYPYSPSAYKGERVKYDWRGVVDVMPGQTLVIGADKATEYYRDDYLKTDIGNKGGYVELQSEFAKRLFLVSNVRRDEHDSFGGHTTYRLAPSVLVPGIETKLKASYGTGFKASSLYQLYAEYYGNATLKPEESKGWDAGFEQPLFGDRVRVGATYFHNDITNLINFVSNAGPYGYGYYENVDQAETSGVETFATWTVNSRLKLRGDYTYTRAIDATTELELVRRPKHKGSVTAIWTPSDQWQLSGTVLSVGKWYDIERGSYPTEYLRADGYTIVNVAAEYKANGQTTIFGRIDNLFDKHYENPSGYLKTGIGVFGGVRVTTP